jgi:glycosyltransferase involved in cell wall biosynthesis
MDRLRRYHFKPTLKLISNGLVLEDSIRPATPPANFEDPERPIKVLCIGRLSKEKDQLTLLKAMKYSANAHRIQLQFAGQGLAEEKIKRKAHKLYKDGILKYEPEFYFLDKQGLKEISAQADMAIHCAFIEVEGLSIMEAIQQGAMPIIAEGRTTGTSQFALARRNIFPVKNPESLAHRIDYWLRHPQERWESGLKHAESIKQYDINKSAEKLVRMFQLAIDNYKK